MLKFDNKSQNWLWFKEFEKSLIANLLKAQELVLAWRNKLRSAEFWNISWLWTAFLMKICSLRIRFAVGQGAKRKLMHWVAGRVPKRYLEKGFPDSFRDGIVLCALTERLTPGACPRFDLLDPGQPLRNLKLALHLMQKHAKIKLNITAEEILEGGKLAEKKLLLLVALMKLAYEKFKLPAASLKSKKDYMSETTYVSETCFARGMGLLLAVRGRKACFTILLNSTDNLDMVIEIRGPKNTACNKRITNVYYLSRSDSSEFQDIMDAQVKEDILSKIIPLTYNILGRKISVSYTPIESGTHNMSIIWQGQHIMGSPYTITVDSSIDNPDIWTSTPNCTYSRLKRSDSQYYDESSNYSKERNLSTCHESSGTIIRKRILRYIVKINGNDVVIDGKEDLCAAISSIKQNRNKNLAYNGDNTQHCSMDNSDLSTNNDSVTKYNSEKNNFSILENSNLSENPKLSVAKRESILSEDTNNSNRLLHSGISSLESNLSIDSFSAVGKQESTLSGDTKYLKNLLVIGSLSSENNDFSNKSSEPNFAKLEVDLSKDIKNSKYLLENGNCVKNLKPTVSNEEQVFPKDTKNVCHFSDNSDINLGNSEKMSENDNLFERINYFQRKNNGTICDNNYIKTDFEKVKIAQNLKTGNVAVAIKNFENSLPDDRLMSDKKEEKIKSQENITDQSNDYNEEKKLIHNFPARNKPETHLGISFVEINNDESEFKCKKHSQNESESLNLNYKKDTGIPGTTNDDISFFPVHKVEYDTLHDDDTDDPDEFNPKRRKSFTELNECNYLEEDCNDSNSYQSGQEKYFSTEINEFDSEDKDMNFEDETLKPEEEPTSLDSLSSSIYSRRASSLFECDHSLAFWSETVDETPVECLPYEESGHLSEEHVSEMWENKLKELDSSVSNEDFSVRLEDYMDDENKNKEYVEKNSHFSTLHGFNDSQNCVASNFVEQPVQISLEEEQNNAQKKSVVEDLSDHRKRLSWSDREALPSIRESSIEGMLEFDIIQSEKVDKEVIQNKSKHIYEMSTKQKSDETYSKSKIQDLSVLQCDEKIITKETAINQTTNEIFPTSSEPQNCVMINSNYLKKDPISKTYTLPGHSEKSTKNEDDSKSSYLSMNILSASPYKNKNTELSNFDSKCSTITKFGSPFMPHPTKNEQTDTSKQKDESENYILTFATPIVIDEHGQLDNPSSAFEAEITEKSNNLHQAESSQDSNQQIPVQSLSVKKVIQIFQKEKEEPIDTWPAETDHSKFQNTHKKLKEVVSAGKNEVKFEVKESGNGANVPSFEKNISPEIFRSSIKDRVKLFEKDKRKDDVSLKEKKKNNAVEKCSDSKVSDRKNYWENMMH